MQSAQGQWNDAGTTVRLQTETGHLTLLVSPLGRGSFSSALSPRPVYVALFIDRGGLRVRLSPAILKELYGFTRTESQIAEQLVNSHSSAEIAAHQKVKDNTVRMQIKSMLAKAGVKRQQELISALILGPARIRLEH